MIYKDITVGIVAFKSQKVIFNCLKKLNKIKNIIIFDNSNEAFFMLYYFVQIISNAEPKSK